MRQCTFIILFLSVLCAGSVSGETNLALHKSYTFSVQPSYDLCSDELDIIQLTDGYASSDMTWIKKSTVGWVRGSTGIEIVIDLERLLPVDQVKIHSVGGGFAEVEFPEFIAVLVSRDGKKYGFAGLVGSEQLPVGGPEDSVQLPVGSRERIPHTFVIDNLNTEARFVKVVIRPKGLLFFTDEIEVIRDEKQSGQKNARRKDLLEFSSGVELLETIEDYSQLHENVRETIKVLQNNRDSFSADFFKEISFELEALAEKSKLPTDEIYLRNELFQLCQRLEATRARIYREVYKKPFVCFIANPMEILLEKDMPLAEAGKQKWIDIQLWQREYESAAVNIINCSQEPLDVIVSISPIARQDGISIESSKTFTIRRAVFVKAIGLGSIADALVLQNEEPFQLQPGRIAQIWLTVFNPALTAGDYKGTFAVAASSSQGKLPIETIPLNLKIERITFPQEVAVNACTWAHGRRLCLNEEIWPEVVKDLKSHHTNVNVIYPGHLSFPQRVTETGLIAGETDYEKMDKFIEINDYARTHLLYLAFELSEYHSRFGKWMSASWEKAFSTWLTLLVEHLKQAGIGYDRFAMYPFDERLGDEFYQVARLIKKVDPNIRIYANRICEEPQDFMRFKDLIDIWCPAEVHSVQYPASLQKLKNSGKPVWTYSAAGPGKSNHPYHYYRLMPWRAFKEGLTGVGFWVYADCDKNPTWNDTLSPFGYYGAVYSSYGSPVDTHGEKVVPSRRWEAWREGIEDYEYLYKLQQVINRVRNSNPTEANEAQRILDDQVKYVLEKEHECNLVYRVREKLTETVLKLLSLESGKLGN